MAMNIKGIRTRVQELLDGVASAKESKEDAISNAEDREEDTEALQNQADILERVEELLNEIDSELDGWES